MNLDEIYPSTANNLKAADLQGREVKCIIESNEIVKFDNGNKVVLKFKGKEKGLVLNKTNANKIGAAHGMSPDAWKGKEIILYPDTTQFNGSMVDCIRVRPVLPVSEGDSEIPF